MQETIPDSRPCRPPNLTENPWSLHELGRAVARIKIYKGADEAGLAIALKNSPDDFQADLLRLFNDILYAGTCPPSWSRTLFFPSDAGEDGAGSTTI